MTVLSHRTDISLDIVAEQPDYDRDISDIHRLYRMPIVFYPMLQPTELDAPRR